MGLLQTAYRTYEAETHLSGQKEQGREPLTPISHMVQNAQIEIELTEEGGFLKASCVPAAENKTIIPVTIESANRAGMVTRAHPLSDQLQYMARFGRKKYEVYLEQLRLWEKSPFTHPKVHAIWRYIEGGEILRDLAASGVITLEGDSPGSGAIEGTPYYKCMVRWRVIPLAEGGTANCWQDQSLFQSFADYYADQCAKKEQITCYLSGQQDTLCETHPKGIVTTKFGAKLISSNDTSGFTYRGRFTNAKEAGCVGYFASQKAHSALRWVAANSGIILGGRTFLCWNPEGLPVPTFAFLGMKSTKTNEFIDYKNELLSTLSGYRKVLPPQADVVIAALEAATEGRLSVTYYNELQGSDFLDRIEEWYTTFCWESRNEGVFSPTIRRIVTCAFGTEQGAHIKADDRVLREHYQQLLHCMVDRKPLPQDIVRALAVRASMPLAYNAENREYLLVTTCAAVRKLCNDRAKKEEWTLALDTSNCDRSYLFGRLLAVAEQAERSTYDRSEGRETNAIRMQAVFAQRPLYAWRIISEQLNPYFSHMNPGLRAYYKNLIGEIMDQLPPTDDADLPKKLEDTYLLGYYQQRTAMTRKKTDAKMEENENEQAEQ